MEGFLMVLGMAVIYLFGLAVAYFFPFTTIAALITVYFTKVGLCGYYIIWTKMPQSPDISGGIAAMILIYLTLVVDILLLNSKIKKIFKKK